MTGVTNIWQSLQVSQPVVGGVPFLGADAQPTVDVTNIYWDLVNSRLYVGCTGDNTKTQKVNTYGQYGAYLPASAVSTVSPDSGLVPGFTGLSSQGTGQIPSYSLTGDMIVQFSGYAYTGAGVAGTYSYRKVGAISVVASGTANDAAGLGGELHLGTKQDKGNFTDWWKLTNLGAFAPMVAGSSDLGAAGYGIRKLFMDYTNTATIGAVTINKAAGQVIVAASATSVVVTNSLVTASSLVFAVVQQADATAIIKNVVPATGSFTINLSAAATANCKVSFFIISTDA